MGLIDVSEPSVENGQLYAVPLPHRFFDGIASGFAAFGFEFVDAKIEYFLGTFSVRHGVGFVGEPSGYGGFLGVVGSFGMAGDRLDGGGEGMLGLGDVCFEGIVEIFAHRRFAFDGVERGADFGRQICRRDVGFVGV